MDSYLIHYVRSEAGLTEPMLADLLRFAEQPGLVYTEFVTPAGFLAIFSNSLVGLKASDRFTESVSQRTRASVEWQRVSSVRREGALLIELNGAGRAKGRPLGGAINDALFGTLRDSR